MSWRDIPGWLPREDKELFDLILSADAGSGDLAELGVYLGASAVVIGAHLQSGETFTVIDLFDSPASDSANLNENRSEYPDLQRAAFEENYRRELGHLPVIVQGESTTIVEYASQGTHRFVHVDASHLYEHVVGDVQAAKWLLAPDGVVCFDDIRSPHTPGVAAAVWAAVANDGLRPFALTEQKLYATWGEPRSWYERVVSWSAHRSVETQTVAGLPLARVVRRPTAGAKRWVPPALAPAARRIRRAAASYRSS